MSLLMEQEFTLKSIRKSKFAEKISESAHSHGQNKFEDSQSQR